jgi:hypothetical protein
VSQIRIYFEGHPGLRVPLGSFLAKAVPSANGKFKLIAGRGRDQTIDDFVVAVRQHRVGSLIILLDSDQADDGRLFVRLQQKTNWKPARKVGANSVYWMVQCMEAWFLADRKALRNVFGERLKAKSLPRGADVETVTKPDMLLKKATRGSDGSPYDKGSHAGKLLACLDPEAVRRGARNFQRLLDTLSEKLD